MSRGGRWSNRRGWWGILNRCLLVSVPAVLIAAAAAAAMGSAAGALSLGLGGGVVVLLSAVTLVVIAWTWDRARDHAVTVAVGAFVAKIVLFALVLGLVQAPEWIQAVPAAIGALVAILAWQTAEVLAFLGTRQQIYDEPGARDPR